MAYLPGVLAAELVGGKQMVLYTRDNSHAQPFSPWVLVETPEEAARSGLVGVSNCVQSQRRRRISCADTLSQLVPFSRSTRPPRSGWHTAF